MIINDFYLKQWAASGGVHPYNERMVQPSSIDLTLSADLVQIVASTVLDASTPNKLYEEHKIHLQYGQKYILQPGSFVLASSAEYIKMPDNCCGLTMLKSTPARVGLGHTYAGFIDSGFEGNITFELFSHVPAILTPGMPICQLLLMELKAVPERLYGETGRYQFQRGPTPARPDSVHPTPVEPTATLRPAGVYKRG